MNYLYGLIPGNMKSDFRRFARRFGITEEDIKRILENERRTEGHNPCTNGRA